MIILAVYVLNIHIFFQIETIKVNRPVTWVLMLKTNL